MASSGSNNLRPLRSLRIAFGALVVATTLAAAPARACLWDSDTLADEKWHSPKLARAILGEEPPVPNVGRLRDRIRSLEANRREDDPAWWNDLAGAHIRLGETKQAVQLLEPAAQRFPNDYGVHANLGTAYHLLGRYVEAEREIASDLEINPNAHFGLERYHLALLQYLVRDREYQSRHVYVDEWSYAFEMGAGAGEPSLPAPEGKLVPGDPWHGIDPGPSMKEWGSSPAAALRKLRVELKRVRAASPSEDRKSRISELQRQIELAEWIHASPPPYRYRWDLAADPKFEEGVAYLATLNPREPACWIMLGIAALRREDLNLAAHAFERSVELNSPQSVALRGWSQWLREHIQESQEHEGPTLRTLENVIENPGPYIAGLSTLLIAGMLLLRFLIRRHLRRRAQLRLRPSQSPEHPIP